MRPSRLGGNPRSNRRCEMTTRKTGVSNSGLERVDLNESGHSITYWKGYGARGKRRFSADNGRTWGRNIVAAFRAAMQSDASDLGHECSYTCNVPGGNHLKCINGLVTGPFPGQYED